MMLHPIDGEQLLAPKPEQPAEEPMGLFEAICWNLMWFLLGAITPPAIYVSFASGWL